MLTVYHWVSMIRVLWTEKLWGKDETSVSDPDHSLYRDANHYVVVVLPMADVRAPLSLLLVFFQLYHQHCNTYINFAKK